MDGYSALGFIGSGNMAEALCKGIQHAALFSNETLIACDINSERRDVFSAMNVPVTDDNQTVLSKGGIIILAVKPQYMLEVLEPLKDSFTDDMLVISIAAGITTEQIEAYTGSTPVIRAMPNTPMLLGTGATALAPGTHATEEHVTAATTVMETGGVVVSIDEEMMDVVTALSGSGPAYFFYIVECLLKAAGEAGLDRAVAETLLFQTVKGAGEMILNAGLSPEKLRDMVTSPGGTTEAAIKSFIKDDLAGTIAGGFDQAIQRGRQLRTKD